jgi:hypothetical protein
MCNWALACGLEDAAAQTSAAAFALRTIGIEAHYRQDLPTTWDDAAGSLDAEDRRRLSAGVAMLSRRGVLSVSNGGGGAVLRFTHSGWLALAGALALGLDEDRWQDLLRPGTAQVTLDALSAALVLDGWSSFSRRHSFLDVLKRLQERGAVEISLEMTLAVIRALQVDDDPLVLGDEELIVLHRSWRSSTDALQLGFVTAVDFRRDQLLVEFLWSQVVPPAFHQNVYRVRRAASETLASLGTFGWETLGNTWTQLTEAARTSDLSSQTRKERPEADWEHYGLPVASLCWILPSVALRLEGKAHEEATALVAELAGIALRNPDTASADISDVGIEISLAEGFKIAAAGLAESAGRLEQSWHGDVEEFLRRARSWVSRAVLLQALALAESNGETARRLAVESLAADNSHPFVREAAALVFRRLGEERANGPLLEDVWLGDVQALDDGGLDLSPEAHRLLGLSTLLINLAENAFKGKDGVRRREVALATGSLPRCFSRPTHTATIFDFDCDCDFKLCGSEARGPVGHRSFSRAFIKRAELTCNAPIVSGGRAFSRKAFRDAWRRLDDELAQSP